ncbi:DUF2066 domain-containing protein [Aliidiomarina sp. B3213]|uniref:DUF2066 domain-containing protein n=1 Tax=Aliidiomarina sp. B3213 TaxID=2249757 RepID=UPI001402A40F|nr:DUF2066 domain-containing protein [Aliidiomarina sp. B3213]
MTNQRNTLFIACLMFAMSFCVVLPTQAQDRELSQLMQVSVPVEDQTRAQRFVAYEEGMKTVIVRASGQSSTLNNPAVSRAFSSAVDYMVTYGYEREEGQLYLQITYSEERIVGLLRQAGAPVWRARRPELMLWIVETQPAGLQLLARDESHWLLDSLLEQSAHRGLPVNMPLLDLNDRMAITPNDVWGRFKEPVLEASSRYPTNGVVMVRLSEGVGVWRAEWTIVIQDFERSGQVDAVNQQSLGAALANQLTEAVARQYAVNYSAADTGYTYLRMTGLNSIQQIAEAEALLRSLGPIVHVTMTRFYSGTAEFELAVVGDASRVESALALERAVEVIDDPWNQVESMFLEYRWLR